MSRYHLNASLNPNWQLKACNAAQSHQRMNAILLNESHGSNALKRMLNWKNLKGAEKWAEAAAESLKNLKNKPKARCN